PHQALFRKPALTLLLHRRDAPQLVEEVEDEHHSVLFRRTGVLRNGDGNALTVGMNSEAACPQREEADLGPRLWLLPNKRIALYVIGRRHHMLIEALKQ